MQNPMPLPADMSGLGARAPAAKQTRADEFAASQGGFSGAQEAASPEEQAAYEALVKNAGKVIYDAKFSRTLAQSLKGSQDAPRAMGQAVATVMARVMGEAKKQGAAIPPEAVLPAVGEAYELVAEIAERIGVPMEDAAFDQGWMHAVDATRVTLSEMGMLPPEALQQDVADMQAEDRGGAPGPQPTPAPARGGFAGAMS